MLLLLLLLLLLGSTLGKPLLLLHRYHSRYHPVPIIPGITRQRMGRVPRGHRLLWYGMLLLSSIMILVLVLLLLLLRHGGLALVMPRIGIVRVHRCRVLLLLLRLARWTPEHLLLGVALLWLLLWLLLLVHAAPNAEVPGSDKGEVDEEAGGDR